MAKEIKRFDFDDPPRRPSRFWDFVARTLSFGNLKRRNFICRCHGTENLKPPYVLLSNHGSIVDLRIMTKITYPAEVNKVATIECFHDYPEWMFRKLGVTGKRRFYKDLNLIKKIKYSLDVMGNIFCMYPEAKYSLDGCTSYIPKSLGKLLKMLKVPVAVINSKGNFITRPQWNKIEKGTHVEADFTLILTPEDLKNKSVNEINDIIAENFVYDDFAWQKENNIIIDHPKRADGLHSLLYQCPHCKTEFQMDSKGTELWCNHCGKRWEMTELGEMKASDGETEFSHIPDWFKWERANVREEVRNGTYHIEDDVRIDTMPNARGFVKQGTGHFVQDSYGLTLTGTAYGKPFEIKRQGCELESMHIEYAYKKIGDVMDIGTENDNFWAYPLNLRDVITKISLGTEEIYLYNKEKIPYKK